jgi:hypothetical protein
MDEDYRPAGWTRPLTDEERAFWIRQREDRQKFRGYFQNTPDKMASHQHMSNGERI